MRCLWETSCEKLHFDSFLSFWWLCSSRFTTASASPCLMSASQVACTQDRKYQRRSHLCGIAHCDFIDLNTYRVLGTGVDSRIDVVLTVREHWSTILTVKCWGSLWLLFAAFSFLGTSVSLSRCLADNMWYCAVPSLTEQVETKPVNQPPKLDWSSETIPYFWDIAWRGFSVPQ